MKLERLFKKITSLAVVVSFFISNHLSLPLLAATNPQGDAFETKASTFPKDIELIKLPETLGKVEDFYQGSEDAAVVIIQDAHAIPDAQINIQKIIQHFQEQYGVSLIGLEGAYSALDPQIFRSFPDQSLLQKVFDEYNQKGELTGGTMAAVFGKTPAVYQGIEDWALYEEGTKLYLSAMTEEGTLKEKLNRWEKDLNGRKQAVYPKALLEVDQELISFQADQTDLLSVLEYLNSYKSLDQGTELSLLLSESTKQGTENNQAEIEVKRLAKELDKALSKIKKTAEDIKILHQKQQLFMTSRITSQEFALSLKELSDKYRVGLQFSSDLLGGVRNQQRMHDIEGTKLFEDFAKYAQSVKDSLIQNENQKKLDQETKQLELIKKLVKLELNREDWDEFQKLHNVIPARFRRESRSPIKTFGDDNNSLSFVSKSDLQKCTDFYLNAQKRDEAFLKRLLPYIEQLKGGSKSALLVAGGFHAHGVRQRLKNKKISYLLLSPKINRLPDGSFYRDHMQGKVSWQKYFRIENGKLSIRDAFIRATRDKLVSLGGFTLLKNWRDQIIRDLVNLKKVASAKDYTRFIDETTTQTPEDEIEKKIARFIEGLRTLKETGRLNQQNILQLLKPNNAIPPITVSAVLTGDPIERNEIIEALNVSQDLVTSSIDAAPPAVPIVAPGTVAPTVSGLEQIVNAARSEMRADVQEYWNDAVFKASFKAAREAIKAADAAIDQFPDQFPDPLKNYRAFADARAARINAEFEQRESAARLEMRLHPNPELSRENLLNTRWFQLGHASVPGTLGYHTMKHSLNGAEGGYLVVMNLPLPSEFEGERKEIAQFMYEVGLVHDWDSIEGGRTPGFPAGVPRTLEALRKDFTREVSLNGIKGRSILRDVFKWSNLQYQIAVAIIQRSEYPFGQSHSNAFYKDKSPLARYQENLSALPERERKLTAYLAPIFSEYADKASWYSLRGFSEAFDATQGLVNEIAATGAADFAKTVLANTATTFLPTIGSKKNFEFDYPIVHDLLGADFKFPSLEQVLSPEAFANFESTIKGFEAVAAALKENPDDVEAAKQAGIAAASAKRSEMREGLSLQVAAVEFNGRLQDIAARYGLKIEGKVTVNFTTVEAARDEITSRLEKSKVSAEGIERVTKVFDYVVEAYRESRRKYNEQRRRAGKENVFAKHREEPVFPDYHDEQHTIEVALGVLRILNRLKIEDPEVLEDAVVSALVHDVGTIDLVGLVQLPNGKGRLVKFQRYQFHEQLGIGDIPTGTQEEQEIFLRALLAKAGMDGDAYNPDIVDATFLQNVENWIKKDYPYTVEKALARSGVNYSPERQARIKWTNEANKFGNLEIKYKFNKDTKKVEKLEKPEMVERNLKPGEQLARLREDVAYQTMSPEKREMYEKVLAASAVADFSAVQAFQGTPDGKVGKTYVRAVAALWNEGGALFNDVWPSPLLDTIAGSKGFADFVADPRIKAYAEILGLGPDEVKKIVSTDLPPGADLANVNLNETVFYQLFGIIGNLYKNKAQKGILDANDIALAKEILSLAGFSEVDINEHVKELDRVDRANRRSEMRKQEVLLKADNNFTKLNLTRWMFSVFPAGDEREDVNKLLREKFYPVFFVDDDQGNKKTSVNQGVVENLVRLLELSTELPASDRLQAVENILLDAIKRTPLSEDRLNTKVAGLIGFYDRNKNLKVRYAKGQSVPVLNFILLQFLTGQVRKNGKLSFNATTDLLHSLTKAERRFQQRQQEKKVPPPVRRPLPPTFPSVTRGMIERRAGMPELNRELYDHRPFFKRGRLQDAEIQETVESLAASVDYGLRKDIEEDEKDEQYRNFIREVGTTEDVVDETSEPTFLGLVSEQMNYFEQKFENAKNAKARSVTRWSVISILPEWLARIDYFVSAIESHLQFVDLQPGLDQEQEKLGKQLTALSELHTRIKILQRKLYDMGKEFEVKEKKSMWSSIVDYVRPRVEAFSQPRFVTEFGKLVSNNRTEFAVGVMGAVVIGTIGIAVLVGLPILMTAMIMTFLTGVVGTILGFWLYFPAQTRSQTGSEGSVVEVSVGPSQARPLEALGKPFATRPDLAGPARSEMRDAVGDFRAGMGLTGPVDYLALSEALKISLRGKEDIAKKIDQYPRSLETPADINEIYNWATGTDVIGKMDDMDLARVFGLFEFYRDSGGYEKMRLFYELIRGNHPDKSYFLNDISIKELYVVSLNKRIEGQLKAIQKILKKKDGLTPEDATTLFGNLDAMQTETVAVFSEVEPLLTRADATGETFAALGKAWRNVGTFVEIVNNSTVISLDKDNQKRKQWLLDFFNQHRQVGPEIQSVELRPFVEQDFNAYAEGFLRGFEFYPGHNAVLALRKLGNIAKTAGDNEAARKRFEEAEALAELVFQSVETAGGIEKGDEYALGTMIQLLLYKEHPKKGLDENLYEENSPDRLQIQALNKVLDRIKNYLLITGKMDEYAQYDLKAYADSDPTDETAREVYERMVFIQKEIKEKKPRKINVRVQQGGVGDRLFSFGDSVNNMAHSRLLPGNFRFNGQLPDYLVNRSDLVFFRTQIMEKNPVEVLADIEIDLERSLGDIAEKSKGPLDDKERSYLVAKETASRSLQKKVRAFSAELKGKPQRPARILDFKEEPQFNRMIDIILRYRFETQLIESLHAPGHELHDESALGLIEATRARITKDSTTTLAAAYLLGIADCREHGITKALMFVMWKNNKMGELMREYSRVVFSTQDGENEILKTLLAEIKEISRLQLYVFDAVVRANFSMEKLYKPKRNAAGELIYSDSIEDVEGHTLNILLEFDEDGNIVRAVLRDAFYQGQGDEQREYQWRDFEIIRRSDEPMKQSDFLKMLGDARYWESDFKNVREVSDIIVNHPWLSKQLQLSQEFGLLKDAAARDSIEEKEQRFILHQLTQRLLKMPDLKDHIEIPAGESEARKKARATVARLGWIASKKFEQLNDFELLNLLEMNRALLDALFNGNVELRSNGLPAGQVEGLRDLQGNKGETPARIFLRADWYAGERRLQAPMDLNVAVARGRLVDLEVPSPILRNGIDENKLLLKKFFIETLRAASTVRSEMRENLLTLPDILNFVQNGDLFYRPLKEGAKGALTPNFSPKKIVRLITMLETAITLEKETLEQMGAASIFMTKDVRDIQFVVYEQSRNRVLEMQKLRNALNLLKIKLERKRDDVLSFVQKEDRVRKFEKAVKGTLTPNFSPKKIDRLITNLDRQITREKDTLGQMEQGEAIDQVQGRILAIKKLQNDLVSLNELLIVRAEARVESQDQAVLRRRALYQINKLQNDFKDLNNEQQRLYRKRDALPTGGWNKNAVAMTERARQALSEQIRAMDDKKAEINRRLQNLRKQVSSLSEGVAIVGTESYDVQFIKKKNNPDFGQELHNLGETFIADFPDIEGVGRYLSEADELMVVKDTSGNVLGFQTLRLDSKRNSVEQSLFYTMQEANGKPNRYRGIGRILISELVRETQRRYKNEEGPPKVTTTKLTSDGKLAWQGAIKSLWGQTLQESSVIKKGKELGEDVEYIDLDLNLLQTASWKKPDMKAESSLDATGHIRDGILIDSKGVPEPVETFMDLVLLIEEVFKWPRADDQEKINPRDWKVIEKMKQLWNERTAKFGNRLAVLNDILERITSTIEETKSNNIGEDNPLGILLSRFPKKMGNATLSPTVRASDLPVPLPASVKEVWHLGIIGDGNRARADLSDVDGKIIAFSKLVSSDFENLFPENEETSVFFKETKDFEEAKAKFISGELAYVISISYSGWSSMWPKPKFVHYDNGLKIFQAPRLEMRVAPENLEISDFRNRMEGIGSVAEGAIPELQNRIIASLGPQAAEALNATLEFVRKYFNDGGSTPSGIPTEKKFRKTRLEISEETSAKLGTPYLIHLVRVPYRQINNLNVLNRLPKDQALALIIADYLHDTLEDTPITQEELSLFLDQIDQLLVQQGISYQVGARALQLVSLMTKPEIDSVPDNQKVKDGRNVGELKASVIDRAVGEFAKVGSTVDQIRRQMKKMSPAEHVKYAKLWGDIKALEKLRDTLYFQKLSTDADAVLLKLADRLDNLSDTKNHDPDNPKSVSFSYDYVRKTLQEFEKELIQNPDDSSIGAKLTAFDKSMFYAALISTMYENDLGNFADILDQAVTPLENYLQEGMLNDSEIQLILALIAPLRIKGFVFDSADSAAVILQKTLLALRRLNGLKVISGLGSLFKDSHEPLVAASRHLEELNKEAPTAEAINEADAFLAKYQKSFFVIQQLQTVMNNIEGRSDLTEEQKLDQLQMSSSLILNLINPDIGSEYQNSIEKGVSYLKDYFEAFESHHRAEADIEALLDLLSSKGIPRDLKLLRLYVGAASEVFDKITIQFQNQNGNVSKPIEWAVESNAKLFGRLFGLDKEVTYSMIEYLSDGKLERDLNVTPQTTSKQFTEFENLSVPAHKRAFYVDGHLSKLADLARSEVRTIIDALKEDNFLTAEEKALLDKDPVAALQSVINRLIQYQGGIDDRGSLPERAAFDGLDRMRYGYEQMQRQLRLPYAFRSEARVSQDEFRKMIDAFPNIIIPQNPKIFEEVKRQVDFKLTDAFKRALSDYRGFEYDFESYKIDFTKLLEYLRQAELLVYKNFSINQFIDKDMIQFWFDRQLFKMAGFEGVVSVSSLTSWMNGQIKSGKLTEDSLSPLSRALIKYDQTVNQFFVREGNRRDERGLLFTKDEIKDMETAKIRQAINDLNNVIQEFGKPKYKLIVSEFDKAVLGQAIGYRAKLQDELLRRSEMRAGLEVFGLMKGRASWNDFQKQMASSEATPIDDDDTNLLLKEAAEFAWEKLGLWKPHEKRDPERTISQELKNQKIDDQRIDRFMSHLHAERILGTFAVFLDKVVQGKLGHVKAKSITSSNFLYRKGDDYVAATGHFRFKQIHWGEGFFDAIRHQPNPEKRKTLFAAALAAILYNQADTVSDAAFIVLLMRVVDPNNELSQLLEKLDAADKKTSLTSEQAEVTLSAISEEKGKVPAKKRLEVGQFLQDYFKIKDPIFSEAAPEPELPIQRLGLDPPIPLGETPFRKISANLVIIQKTAEELARKGTRLKLGYITITANQPLSIAEAMKGPHEPGFHSVYPFKITVGNDSLEKMNEDQIKAILQKHGIEYGLATEMMEVLAEAFLIYSGLSESYFGVTPMDESMRHKMLSLITEIFVPGKEVSPLDLSEMVKVLNGELKGVWVGVEKINFRKESFSDKISTLKTSIWIARSEARDAESEFKEAVLKEFSIDELRIVLMDSLTFPEGYARRDFPSSVAKFDQFIAEFLENSQSGSVFQLDKAGVFPSNRIIQQIIREDEERRGISLLDVGNEIINVRSGTVRRVIGRTSDRKYIVSVHRAQRNSTLPEVFGDEQILSGSELMSYIQDKERRYTINRLSYRDLRNIYRSEARDSSSVLSGIALPVTLYLLTKADQVDLSSPTEALAEYLQNGILSLDDIQAYLLETARALQTGDKMHRFVESDINEARNEIRSVIQSMLAEASDINQGFAAGLDLRALAEGEIGPDIALRAVKAFADMVSQTGLGTAPKNNQRFVITGARQVGPDLIGSLSKTMNVTTVTVRGLGGVLLSSNQTFLPIGKLDGTVLETANPQVKSMVATLIKGKKDAVSFAAEDLALQIIIFNMLATALGKNETQIATWRQRLSNQVALLRESTFQGIVKFDQDNNIFVDANPIYLMLMKLATEAQAAELRRIAA